MSGTVHYPDHRPSKRTKNNQMVQHLGNVDDEAELSIRAFLSSFKWDW